MRRRPSSVGAVLRALAGLTAVVALASCSSAGGAGADPPAPAPAAATPALTPPVPTTAPAPPPTPTPTASPTPSARVTAVRVSIPHLGVSSSLERLHLDAHGVLVPPEDPLRAGWFTAGPVPGDLGPAVIAGHVDSLQGRAVFYELKQLREGDRVRVERSDGRTVEFRVLEVDRVPKDHFPTQDVYGPTPDRALRLITCGGAYLRHAGGYQDNVVVYAVAV